MSCSMIYFCKIGLLALGAYSDPNGINSERAQRDLKTARAVTYTCYQMCVLFDTSQ